MKAEKLLFEDKDKEDDGDLLYDLMGLNDESLEYQRQLEAQIENERRMKKEYEKGKNAAMSVMELER